MSKNGKEQRIVSARNPKLTAAIRLRKRRDRDRLGLILIEGAREISRALDRGITVNRVFTCAACDMREDEQLLIKDFKRQRIELIEVGAKAFEKIAYREGTIRFVAVGERPNLGMNAIPSVDTPLYIVMDDVEKPGNLGAVLRSADGAGVTAVIASDERTDLYNPNVIRASLGTIFTVPTVATTAKEAIQWLTSKGVQIVVTTPAADTLYTEADLTGPTAIVVGSEDRGVRQEWLEAADVKVKIPMLGSADSLNVAQSATILVYEALRQRSTVGE
jgi:TrmH family RNA methyltransferase